MMILTGPLGEPTSTIDSFESTLTAALNHSLVNVADTCVSTWVGITPVSHLKQRNKKIMNTQVYLLSDKDRVVLTINHLLSHFKPLKPFLHRHSYLVL